MKASILDIAETTDNIDNQDTVNSTDNIDNLDTIDTFDNLDKEEIVPNLIECFGNRELAAYFMQLLRADAVANPGSLDKLDKLAAFPFEAAPQSNIPPSPPDPDVPRNPATSNDAGS